MMKRNHLFLSTVFIATILLLSSCSDDDPVLPNEEELITTIIVSLEPQSGEETLHWTFRDPDGADGGQQPAITADALQNGVTYNANIELLNEAESPAESITAEIEAEAEEHQFFFSGSAIDNQLLTVAYADEDGNGNPVGLEFTVQTSADGGTGNFTVILRHEPDKSASGVNEGDISNAGGETDVEITFAVTVQ